MTDQRAGVPCGYCAGPDYWTEDEFGMPEPKGPLADPHPECLAMVDEYEEERRRAGF